MHVPGITLSDSQEEIVENFPGFLLNDDQEMCISGFAGSGKSFLVRYLADVGNRQQKLVNVIDREIPIRTFHFTATTNKAARVLQAVVGQEVTTIHKALGLVVKNNYKNGTTSLKQEGDCIRLSDALIFIDEASMVNQQLLNKIRECIKPYPYAKIVYIGDSYQLPPVKEQLCPVFTQVKDNSELLEIQRQVKGSPIIQLSAKFRDCLDDHTLEWPALASNAAITHYSDIKDFTDEIHSAYSQPHGPDDYKIIAWTNNRVREFNDWIRMVHELPEAYVAGEQVISNKPLMSNKKVIAPTDSFHKIGSCEPCTTQGLEGWRITLMGEMITYFQPKSWEEGNRHLKNIARQVKAKEKSWADYFKIKEEWADFRPVHASTVHKSQGSTYREVFVDLNNIAKCNQWRDVARLVYVAITRASHKVHLYGNLEARYNKGPVVDPMEPFKNVDFI